MLEPLESRTVPYGTIGAWPHPELVTISFMPDGTNLGGSLSSNLLASFNAKWPTAVWQSQILRAAQTWAQYTDLNFAVVPDDGLPFGWAAYQQGAAGEGDIRIGGFNFGPTDVIGEAWFPPPLNNYAVAGEVFLNTAQPFNIGSTYDLYTVATHELGHALGLVHSTDYYAAMYGAYVGAKNGLTWDDVGGIRSLYSGGAPRSPDGFGFYTSSFQTAADLTGAFDPVTQTLVGARLDITNPGQAEYYRFLAPYGTSSQLTVTIQSSGLSMLSPYVVLYDAYQRPIAAASGYGQYGTTVSVSVGGVVPTELYWLRVSGADASAFGTGRYAVCLNFGTGPTPNVPPPNTATPNSIPSVGIGGLAEDSGAVGADGQGSDSFEPEPAHDGDTSRHLPDEPGPAHLPVGEAALLVHPASGQPSQGSLLVYAMRQGPGVAAIEAAGMLVPPLFESRVPQPANGHPESGRGTSSALLAEVELPEGTDSPPAPSPKTSHSLPPKRSALLPRWRAECTAYFTEQTRAVGQKDGRALAPCSGETDASVAIDSAAAITGLTVALGGYWGDQADEVLGWRKAALGLLGGRNRR